MCDLVDVNCFCCGKVLETEPSDDPLVIAPLYDGLIFRSNGNFGSTVFDPMPICREEMLQIIICDNCIRGRLRWVTRLYNIIETTTADSEVFDPEKE